MKAAPFLCPPLTGVKALLVLTYAVVHAPCAPPGGPTKEPFLIGVSNAQSGQISVLGKDLIAGAQAYFDQVNAAGGVHGRSIRVLVKDDGYNPGPALANTNRLIVKDRVLFLVGYVGTSTLTRVLPLLQYYEGEHIVNFAPLTGSDVQRRPPFDRFVFNVRASYREETQALVDVLYHRGHRRIGFFGQSDAYGKDGEVGTIEALKRYGLPLIAAAYYRRGSLLAADMRQQVAFLREKGVDAVISFSVYGPTGAFIRDARDAGWRVPIAAPSFASSEEISRSRLHPDSKGNLDYTANLVTSEVVPSFLEDHYPLIADYNRTIPAGERSLISLEGWLDAVVAVEGLRRMKPPFTRECFTQALESLGGWDPGLNTPLSFSPTNHQGLKRIWVRETSNLRWTPVRDMQAGSK